MTPAIPRAEVAEWQTRMVQDHVSARTWGFNSPLRHHTILAHQIERETRCGRQSDCVHKLSMLASLLLLAVLVVLVICARAPAGPDRLPEQVLDLPVCASQFVTSPGLQVVPEILVYSKHKLTLIGHPHVPSTEVHPAGVSLVIQGARVDHWLCLGLAAEHDQQIADHRRLAFLVQLYDLLL